MVFEGFNQIDSMTEIRGEMNLDALGLSKIDIVSFQMPDYSRVVSNLKSITDPEVRHYIISNTYLPVLRSHRKDAFRAFRQFCSDLGWDTKEIKESMEITESISDLKPINDVPNVSSKAGCLTVVAFVIVSTTLLAFTVI